MKKQAEKLSSEMRELVCRAVESDTLDYKAAFCWTRMSRVQRAKIVRHCLALANTRGGHIVIGVGEDASGHPSVYQGLTREESRSFDPSTVGPFINHYVEPPIDFTIERPLIDGKRYAVFVIRPFRSLPHVCTCAIENELQTGVFYIRTTDASSRPAYRAIEMQGLIQRALRNQREELGRMLRGILYENRANTENGSAADEFREAANHAVIFFKRRKSPPPHTPAIFANLTVTPPEFHPEAFTLSRIRHAANRALASLAASEFITPEEMKKAHLTNLSLRSLSETRLQMWQLFQSGLFHYVAWWPIPGRELSLDYLIRFSAEAVNYLGALYAELGYVEELLTIRLVLVHTENCRLVPENPQPEEEFRCRIPEVEIEITRSAADLATGSVNHAARLVREIGERFNLPDYYWRGLPGKMQSYLEQR